MSELKDFLEKSYENSKNWKNFDEFHIVLGNESCDLDSTISAISYGYFLYARTNGRGTVAVLPVLNVTRGDFKLRTEHCDLLKNAGVDLDKLIYRDEISFENFVGKCKTYLVDHHVLAKSDGVLEDSICKILDHRPVDGGTKWPKSVDVRIELVGSCATLVADEILKNRPEILLENLAYLLYCTIIFDTLAALPENKKAKPLDIEMLQKFEEKFGFDKSETRMELFMKIVKLHDDVSHLTPKQLLNRDLKFVEEIPIPSLPMLVENFIELPNALKSVEEMCAENNSNFTVLVGIERIPKVRKDVGLFFMEKSSHDEEALVKHFEDAAELTFTFDSIEKDCVAVAISRINNAECTRKQIIPIVQKFLNTRKS